MLGPEGESAPSAYWAHQWDLPWVQEHPAVHRAGGNLSEMSRVIPYVFYGDEVRTMKEWKVRGATSVRCRKVGPTLMAGGLQVQR
eukprot:2267137-Alexandrium_andersonii.AAC.1